VTTGADEISQIPAINLMMMMPHTPHCDERRRPRRGAPAAVQNG